MMSGVILAHEAIEGRLIVVRLALVGNPGIELGLKCVLSASMAVPKSGSRGSS
jgi:hypothetical protein